MLVTTELLAQLGVLAPPPAPPYWTPLAVAVFVITALAEWIVIGVKVEKIRVIKKGIINGFLITSNYTRAGLGITGWTG